MRSGAGGLAVYLAVAPLLALVHEALAVAAAVLLRAGTELAEVALLPLLPVDPVYGGAALHVLGGIEARGLAVAGPLGEVLHRAAPAWFAASAPPAGALVSAVIEPGATIAARTLVVVAATVPMLALGIGLARRRSPSWLAVAAGLFQAHLLVEQVVGTRLTLRELEATGLPFALAAFAPVGEGGQRVLFTRQLDGVPDAVVGYAWGSFLALTCYLVAGGLAHVPNAARRALRRRGREREVSPAAVRLRRLPRLALRGAVLAALALALVVSPLGVLADAEVDFLVEAPVTGESWAMALDFVPIDSSPPTAEADAVAAPATSATESVVAAPSTLPAARPAPSVVTLEGENYRYVYRVNGAPTVIRGMGYNPWYAGLDRAERARLYERDFAAMERIGINTIEGWFQQQFDDVTLDAAHAHGIGVIMPFELNHDYDYTDPRIRAAFTEAVADWVLRYRDHPAVRMWAPSNEMMHRLIFPTIVSGQRDPAREARADAFAAFFVELIDMIHALDPNHPIVYRDAEDHYLSRLRDALLRDGKRRPWFVYGTNAYTPRLEQVIARWPSQGLDAPLLVSEFSPGGVAPADRPHQFAWFWSMIRAQPEMVLGGVVYTWATEGPEDLDRVFGLTDPDGRPVDGSLVALGRLFRREGPPTRDRS